MTAPAPISAAQEAMVVPNRTLCTHAVLKAFLALRPHVAVVPPVGARLGAACLPPCTGSPRPRHLA
eukprot:9839769-Alexandrium_andersonii.AAC.1